MQSHTIHYVIYAPTMLHEKLTEFGVPHALHDTFCLINAKHIVQMQIFWIGLFPFFFFFVVFFGAFQMLQSAPPSRIWNNCCQEKWKVMSKQWAKTCCECIHTTYCFAGAQAGPLFAWASCTPLLHRPSPCFSIFPLVLSVQALPSVSSGMPALPCPSPLCSTSSPWLGGLAARRGQPAHLRGSWHAWWTHSSDLRARVGGPQWKGVGMVGVASWALLLTLLG